MSSKIPTDAFDYYVALGTERSYQAVADHYGVSKRATTKCAAREDWATRLSKIESAARETSDQRLAETLEETRSRHLRMLRAMGTRAIAALKQYPLSSGMEAMRAAEMVIKLERLVTGEATERHASVEEVIRREFEEWMSTEEEGGAEDGCVA